MLSNQVEDEGGFTESDVRDMLRQVWAVEGEGVMFIDPEARISERAGRYGSRLKRRIGADGTEQHRPAQSPQTCADPYTDLNVRAVRQGTLHLELAHESYLPGLPRQADASACPRTGPRMKKAKNPWK